MKNQDFIKDKNIFVLGLGKSGLSAAVLYSQLGAQVAAHDSKDLSGSETEALLLDHDVAVLSQEEAETLIESGIDFLVKSPGIPYHHPLIQKAEELGRKIYTDIEIAYHLSEAPIIGITGTNGKTTVTTLIGDMLDHSSKKAYISGNIGIPVSEVVTELTSDDSFIMELSSFQLLGTEDFRPKISVITNLYTAHLDYHGSREEYIKAKLKLLSNQTSSDFFVYNADSKELAELAKLSPARTIPFSATQVLDSGCCIKAEGLYYDQEKIMDTEDILMPGQHNLENICAAVAVAKLLEVDDEPVVQTLTTFSGIKHRLQYVADVKERKFYNDSKATNVLAASQALKSFSQPILWICGGLDRQEDLSPLLPLVEAHVKGILAVGENRQDFIALGEKAGLPLVESCDKLEEAVELAFNRSDEGDVILLSPASASWDQYESFEIRGDIFIEAVAELSKAQKNEEV